MWKGGPCGPSATVHRHWPPLGWPRTTSRFQFDGSASSLSKEKKRTGKNDRASLKPSFPPLFPGSVLCLKLNFCFLPKRMMERGKKKKKKPPRVEKWLLLTADFLPWPRRQSRVLNSPLAARLYANEKLFPCLPI